MDISLITNKAQYKVSSVLGKDVRNYGKQHLFDGKEETCWNSDQVKFIEELSRLLNYSCPHLLNLLPVFIRLH